MPTAKEVYAQLRSCVDIAYYVGQPGADLLDEAVGLAVHPTDATDPTEPTTESESDSALSAKKDK